MTLFRARWWDAEHGLQLVVLHGERDAAQKGGWLPSTTPPSVGETLSWLECSPSMLRLLWRQTGPPCCAIRGKGG
jgi:hypothetical protein